MEQFKAFFLQSFRQWERLRHPYAGWLRIGLGVLLPFIVWSHSALLIVLWLTAFVSHPWWFPQHVEVTEDMPFMTRLTDAVQAWLERATPLEKAQLFLPGFALAWPLLCALWQHHFFWSLYFVAAVAAYKTICVYCLLEKGKTDDLAE